MAQEDAKKLGNQLKDNYKKNKSYLYNISKGGDIMGLVIRISFCYDWERTYFVQELNREEAKTKGIQNVQVNNELCFAGNIRRSGTR